MKARRYRYRLGHAAERWAGLFLWCKCYRACARRYKTPVGEIDLIVTRGRQIVFCEVKARRALADGLYAVTPQARLRIARAAEHFCQANPRYQNFDWRFDALVVRPWRLPYHLQDAWRPRRRPCPCGDRR